VKVGWLHDNPGYWGGAELTMQEFKAAAPDGVEVIDCLPGNVAPKLDRYVVGNCMSYSPDEVPAAEVVRYHHDVAHAPADDVLDRRARHIFCSPLQKERMGMRGKCIPPALDLSAYEAVASQNHRKGNVCIGRMAYGKGLELLAEYDEPVDVYSSVPISSGGSVNYRGATKDVAGTLARYSRFIFLPTAIEPFGRAVVEAWAAGCELVVNRNVGALHWINEAPEKLETAAEDFWKAVRWPTLDTGRGK
jgi:hypothetical protein